MMVDISYCYGIIKAHKEDTEMEIGYTETYKGHTITLKQKSWNIDGKIDIPTWQSPYRYIDEMEERK